MNWAKIERLFGERFLPPEAMLTLLRADQNRVQMGRKPPPERREWGIRIEILKVSTVSEPQPASPPQGPAMHRDVM
jgi:hypothetical protein